MIWYPPPGPHLCVDHLPQQDLPEGTIATCGHCGKAWFVDTWDGHHWRPVRWYHWRMQQRMHRT